MRVTRVLLCGAILLLGVAAWAQEFPKAEIGVNYSYADYHASTPYSHSHSLNGGGGELNFNFNEFVSIKMDLQGYGSNVTTFNIAPNSTFPFGASGNAKGDLFTYLFGPQYKVRAHRLQPYGHFLIGGAHTNVYGNAFIGNLPPYRSWMCLLEIFHSRGVCLGRGRRSRYSVRQALCNSSVRV